MYRAQRYPCQRSGALRRSAIKNGQVIDHLLYAISREESPGGD
jgi:hypothetical protein